MIRILIYILIFSFLSNCSFNKNSKLWNKKEIKIENKKNIKRIVSKEKIIEKELNSNLKLDLSNIKYNTSLNNYNDFGFQLYQGNLDYIGNFKFSRHGNDEFTKTNPVFFENGLIYFDNKGSILRFGNNKKIIWKKNYYTKLEIKSNPKLTFNIHKDKLIVVDNISNLYLINLNNGNLIWKKNNDYPFNSEIKIHKEKFFVVDYLNTLKCYKLADGSECWNVKTEDAFTISDTKNSIIVVNNRLVFNNSIGDITAVDINTGSIIWQTPTQSSKIKDKTYNFKISQIVSDGESVFFSNNNNEFYSIDLRTGILNWLNNINSSVTPIILNNLIFTVSKDGYFYVIQKKQGNIIRINDIYKNLQIKKFNKKEPVGFVIGKDFFYVTNMDGKLMKINLNNVKIVKIENISKSTVSKPIIFNKKLYVVRNGSILEYN